MLAMENVTAGYNGTDVIFDISLSLPLGENLSIIGPNGCGKTTLLRAIAGVLPSLGNITLNGEPLKKMKHREIAKKIALLSQTHGLYFAYSVFDTVMMGRYPHIKDRLQGRPSSEDRAHVMRCLEAVELSGIPDKDITKLSGGQLQRVFLARTLAQDPEIILLDEPANHLDLKSQIELIKYLKHWTAQGDRSIIGVMHDINFAASLSQNILALKNGRVFATGATNDIINAELLAEMYEIDASYLKGYQEHSLLSQEL